MASARRAASSRGALRTWSASRCAVFRPMEGRRANSSMRFSRKRLDRDTSGPSALRAYRAIRLEGKPSAERARDLGQRGLHHLFGPAMGLVDGREDEVLEHLDVAVLDRL